MRGFIIILLVLTSCQVGKIPCPKVKYDPVRKQFRSSPSALTAKATQDTEPVRQGKDKSERYVTNVSAEEWDCPKPGSKKYMPKSVKNNIRKNKKMVESGKQITMPSDSVSNP